MLIVNVAGAALIGLIVWWFWLYKAEAGCYWMTQTWLIVVENGTYHPARIKLAANRATELNFLRKDASPCSEMLLIPGSGHQRKSAVEQAQDIQIATSGEGRVPVSLPDADVSWCAKSRVGKKPAPVTVL